MNVLSLSVCLLVLLCFQYTLNLLTDFQFNIKQRFRGYEISWMLVAGWRPLSVRTAQHLWGTSPIQYGADWKYGRFWDIGIQRAQRVLCCRGPGKQLREELSGKQETCTQKS